VQKGKMKAEDELFTEALAALPLPDLSRSVSSRTLVRARGHLVPSAQSAPPRPCLQRIPAQAIPAFLWSVDLVFVADACFKMARVFGG
jgi:hypothetical protein